MRQPRSSETRRRRNKTPRPPTKNPRREIIVDELFGVLRILEHTPNDKYGNRMVRVFCELCGSDEQILRFTMVANGRYRSCKCLEKAALPGVMQGIIDAIPYETRRVILADDLAVGPWKTATKYHMQKIAIDFLRRHEHRRLDGLPDELREDIFYAAQRRFTYAERRYHLNIAELRRICFAWERQCRLEAISALELLQTAPAETIALWRTVANYTTDLLDRANYGLDHPHTHFTDEEVRRLRRRPQDAKGAIQAYEDGFDGVFGKVYAIAGTLSRVERLALLGEDGMQLVVRGRRTLELQRERALEAIERRETGKPKGPSKRSKPKWDKKRYPRSPGHYRDCVATLCQDLVP
jgi:hypothetical protein